MISLLLLSYLLLGCISPAEMVTIHYNSSSNFMPLGTYLTFRCAFESPLPFLHSFKVTIYNQTPVLTLSDAVISNLRERGIVTERRSDTLTVRASKANNLTVVECSDGNFDPAVFSQPVQMVVIGPPLAPHVEFTLVSFTELRLEWEEPFTWPDYNITGYRINETLADSGMTSTTTTTLTAYSHLRPNGGTQQSCQNITFTVSAYSDIGFGEPFVATYGLPIELAEFKDMNATVQFTKIGDPEVKISVQVPPVCEYQTAWLVLRLTDEDGDSLTIMSHTYRGSSPLLSFLYSGQLRPNTKYSLKASVSTVMQNVSKTVHFDTQLPQNNINNIALVIGGVVGGLAIAVILLFSILCVLCACLQIKCGKQKTQQEMPKSQSQDEVKLNML